MQYKSKLRLTTITSILLIVSACPCLAQDNLPSNDFFKSDFVHGTTGLGEKEKKRQAEASEPSKVEDSSTSDAAEKEEDSQENLFESNKIKAEKTKDVFESAGKKPLYVGAILNGFNEASLKKESEQFAAALADKNLPAGRVYVFGTRDQKLPDKLSSELYPRGGGVRLITELPEKYQQVKQTPVWIVGLPDGEVLLEAVGPIARYFNSRGEFIGADAGSPSH